MQGQGERQRAEANGSKDPRSLTPSAPPKILPSSCLGKRVHYLGERGPASPTAIHHARLSLAHLERAFRARVSGAAGSKYEDRDVSR